jgi:hypothetical protein
VKSIAVKKSPVALCRTGFDLVPCPKFGVGIVHDAVEQAEELNRERDGVVYGSIAAGST